MATGARCRTGRRRTRTRVVEGSGGLAALGGGAVAGAPGRDSAPRIAHPATAVRRSLRPLRRGGRGPARRRRYLPDRTMAAGRDRPEGPRLGAGRDRVPEPAGPAARGAALRSD